MDTLFKLSFVFILGAAPWIEVGAAIIVGVGLGLSPFLSFFAAVTGNISTVILVSFMVMFMRNYFYRKFFATAGDNFPINKTKKFYKLWEQYGLPGVAFASPMTIGTHFGAIFALLVGSPIYKVLWWFIISVSFWGIVFTVLSYLGWEGLKRFL